MKRKIRKPNIDKVLGFDKDIVKFIYVELTNGARVDTYEATEKIVIQSSDFRTTIRACEMDSLIWKMKSPYIGFSMRTTDNAGNNVMSSSNLNVGVTSNIAKMLEQVEEKDKAKEVTESCDKLQSIISKF